jgi:hypothetical protein
MDQELEDAGIAHFRRARLLFDFFGNVRFFFGFSKEGNMSPAWTSFRVFTSTLGPSTCSSSSGFTWRTFNRLSLILGRVAAICRVSCIARDSTCSFDGISAPSKVMQS